MTSMTIRELIAGLEVLPIPPTKSDPDIKLKHSVLMIVPNPIVKKLFELVLKSDKMAAFVREYEEDSPTWLDKLMELTVSFATTTGDESGFSRMERRYRLKFKANMEAKLKEREEEMAKRTFAEKTNASLTESLEKNDDIRYETDKAKTPDDINGTRNSTDAAPTKGFKRKISIRPVDCTPHQTKPVLPVITHEKKLQVKIDITSEDEESHEGPLSQTLALNKGQKELGQRGQKVKEMKEDLPKIVKKNENLPNKTSKAMEFEKPNPIFHSSADASADATDSRKKIFIEKKCDESSDHNPVVLPEKAFVKRLTRKRLFEGAITFSEEGESVGVFLTPPTGGGQHETELVQQICKANTAKKQRLMDSSDDVLDDKLKGISYLQTDKKDEKDKAGNILRCPSSK